MGSQESLAADPGLLPQPQDHINVTTSASTMERILSDDRIANDSHSTATPHANQFVYPQQTQMQAPYTAISPQQFSPYTANNQAYPPGCSAYVYQQSPPVAIQPPAAQTVQMSQNVALPLPNSTPQQLQFELQQQMQQLHLLQQAQQLEQQRLDLARLQRNLDVQLQSQQRQQHELQVQMQQEQQAKMLAAAQAQANLAKAQAQAQLQQEQNNQHIAVAKHNEKRTQVQTEKKQNESYPVVFHWNHGGRVVHIAYSGDNWSHKYKMHRSHNDFSLIMEISPGVYHYKFIVDNQWRVARNQPHVRDANGAYSNVLDVRSHSYQRIMDEKEKKRKREKQKAQYHTNLPAADHYVQDPPICPVHLHNVVLNNNDNEDEDDGLGNDEHSDPMEVSVANKASNVNTMELPKPLRVSLNHLCVSDKREEEVVTLGMTERYRDKFFTTVYYTPLQRVVT